MKDTYNGTRVQRLPQSGEQKNRESESGRGIGHGIDRPNFLSCMMTEMKYIAKHSHLAIVDASLAGEP